MAFIFPADGNGVIGAVRTTVGDNNFFVPAVLYSTDAVTPLFTLSNPGYVIVSGTVGTSGGGTTYVEGSGSFASGTVVYVGNGSGSPVPVTGNMTVTGTVLTLPASGSYVTVNGIASTPVVIEASQTLLPTDLQTIYRSQLIFYNTPLSASGTWDSSQASGGGVDCISLKRVTGKLYADVAGSLLLYESDDNTANYWDMVGQPIDLPGGLPVTFGWDVQSRYLKVIYYNGPTTQATFRFSLYGSVV